MKQSGIATACGIFEIEQDDDTIIVVPAVDLRELDFQRIEGGGQGGFWPLERHRHQECRPRLSQDGLLWVYCPRLLRETLEEGQEAEWTNGLLQCLSPREGNPPNRKYGLHLADLLVEERGVGGGQGMSGLALAQRLAKWV